VLLRTARDTRLATTKQNTIELINALMDGFAHDWRTAE